MQFVYHPNAGENPLIVDTKEYAHLFKVRRVSIGDTLTWRNLEDDYLYEYTITRIDKKESHLEQVAKQESRIVASKSLHIGWCVVDPKSIEKTLPMLNELGVEKISFVFSDFSQKQYKVDEERLKRILINSSQQCGRSNLMRIEVLKNVKNYLELYPSSVILDFSADVLTNETSITSILIGPEGGFSAKEREMFLQKEVFGLDCPTILRSETAVVVVTSKIIA
ncbi:MAG: 16S rRNA (uracil(1498)-N(3))-methyltransferase [Sulfurospirillaceae bacterium]|nr:16S rRNA (uracil(1498)-N(3))-methyltransferase [Sulfurospirillaceae bacterium]MDD2825468.1 16S rRNA (uracil(1498)-N(3))-methyltransferase [Sulfurospirillaceae bacterium]MDD3341996.1 16S rRNA (uracil(1498)-N(3))-methyltransferase [Sulfurospirillaceae bacterium]